MGTQKNHGIETVLLSTQNMLKLIGKKIITFKNTVPMGEVTLGKISCFFFMSSALFFKINFFE